MTNNDDTRKINRNVWNFYVDEDGKHRWRCSDVSGDILFISAQGYVDRSGAEQCAKRAGWDADFDVRDPKPKEV